MCCEEIERQLGRYIDNELSAAEREQVDTHLAYCSSCRVELDELRETVSGLSVRSDVSVPDSLWPSIQRRLHPTAPSGSAARPIRLLRRRLAPWAIAAGVVLAVGLGMFGLSTLDTTAQASSVDFRALLDALPLDAHKAFSKFLLRYDAKPTTPVAAKRIAPDLNFDTPSVLPGGFKLTGVYELRIGSSKAIAASYDRNGEFLAAVFHRPMKHENFGKHQNYQCMIGKHCGHKVQVGEWKLVHLTDPTTCHCLLSRLDERTEIPAVMAAIAPKSAETPAGTPHAHP